MKAIAIIFFSLFISFNSNAEVTDYLIDSSYVNTIGNHVRVQLEIQGQSGADLEFIDRTKVKMMARDLNVKIDYVDIVFSGGFATQIEFTGEKEKVALAVKRFNTTYYEKLKKFLILANE